MLNLDASTYLYQEGDFPAIVSKEVWNKAQSIRLNRRKPVALKDGKVTISNRSSEDIWVNKLRCSCGYACRRDKWHVRKDGSISYGYQRSATEHSMASGAFWMTGAPASPGAYANTADLSVWAPLTEPT